MMQEEWVTIGGGELEALFFVFLVIAIAIFIPVFVYWLFFKFDIIEKVFQLRLKLYNKKLKRKEAYLAVREKDLIVKTKLHKLRAAEKDVVGERRIIRLLREIGDRKHGRVTWQGTLAKIGEEKKDSGDARTEEILRDGHRILTEEI